MSRFQRAFLGELLLAFVAIMSVTTAVVFAGFALYIVTDAEEAATQFLVDLLPKLLPWAVAYSLPFAWLGAVTIVARRMAAENEVTALRASGIHMRTLVLPLAAVGALLAVGGMAFDGWVWPQAQRGIKLGLDRHLPAFLESLKGANRSIVMGDGRFSYGRYEDGVFHEVELDQRASDGTLRRKFLASRARIRRVDVPGEKDGGLEFRMDEVHFFDAALGTGPDHRYQANETVLQTGRVESIGGTTLFNQLLGVRRFLLRPKEMTVPELLYAVERGGVWRGDRLDVLMQVHGRLSLGASPFALGLLALAVALLLPVGRGRVRDFVLCFLPAILVFFGLFLVGPNLAQAGLPTWLALWSPNLVVGGAGLVLFAWVFRR